MMKIRRFELGDSNQILQVEAYAFPKTSYTSQIFLHSHHAFPDTFLFIEEDKLLGYIIFTPDGHIISLAVDPAHRRKGIGTQLINACESQFWISRLLVEVRERNIGAQKFYEKLGFQQKSKIRLYYGTEDAYVMEKKIYRTA